MNRIDTNSAPPQDPRLLVLRHILAQLQREGHSFALLHGGMHDVPSVDSDVDLAFAAPPPRTIEPILQRLHRDGELTLLQRLHYDVPHAYYYILRVPGDGALYLHLDCLCDPIGINRYGLPTSFLLEGAQPAAFAPRIYPPRETLYLLMKRAIKGKVSTASLAELQWRLREHWDDFSTQAPRWFGPAIHGHIDELLAARDTIAARTPLQAIAAGARIARKTQSANPLRRAMQNVYRQLKRLLRPTGYFVVLVGPDGSGKSTVGGMLLERAERAFRRTSRFHWRPGLLPKLGRQTSDATATANEPPTQTTYGTSLSLVRFGYYWLDFVLGYWLTVYPRKAQSTLVLGERYFPDILVHPQRYGFALPRWLMRFAAWFVPKPDLLVVLKDEPRKIFARKAELPIATIAQQIADYEAEASHWGEIAVVQTSGTAEQVADRVAELVLRGCAERTQSRLAGTHRSTGWRAFPSGANVKVWIADDDRLSNGLHLYHPYSRGGQLAKAACRLLPSWARAMVLRTHANTHLKRRLESWAEIIRTTLSEPSLKISFAPGTRGPDQKATAQVSRFDKPICYVKIASSEAAKALLAREADMLEWLQARGFKAAAVPCVLARRSSGADSLLFVSCPDRSVRPTQQAVHANELAFLAQLASLGGGQIALSDYLSRCGIAAYATEVAQSDERAARIVCSAMHYLERQLGAEGIQTTPSHGDYAPWNTRQLDDDNLYVFDWEYGDWRAPALTDLFHRMFMPGRYLSNLGPRRSVETILRAATESHFAPVIAQAGVTAQRVPCYLILYFLFQLASRRQGAEEDDYMVRAIEHGMRLAEGASQRKKVLVAAYACEPGRGSEPGVGWRMCQAISREHEAWVITRKNNREKIERTLAEQPNPNLHFVYADLPPWARFWKKGERGVRTYYYLWQFAALMEARRLMREVAFDVGHHVTFVNDYMFTFFTFLPLPFVWGPIGSPCRRPAGLWEKGPRLHWERREYYFKCALRALDPLFWLSSIRAKVVVGIDEEIGRRFPIGLLAKHKFIAHTAIGVERELTELAPLQTHAPGEFLVLSVGRLVRLKSFDLTIRAFAQLAETVSDAHLRIIGDGPLQADLKQLAKDLNVADRVEFLRPMPRAQAMAMMRNADVFLFPSYEAEGMVVLEALAQGLPVVCLNYGGPGKMTTPECGFTVSIGSLRQTVDRLAEGLRALAADPILQKRMAASAHQRILDHYLWETRHELIRQWYAATVPAHQAVDRDPERKSH